MYIVIHIEAEQMSSCFYFSLNQAYNWYLRDELIFNIENESDSGQNLSLYTEKQMIRFYFQSYVGIFQFEESRLIRLFVLIENKLVDLSCANDRYLFE